MLITDCRFPLFHFPQPLYSYIVNDLKKSLLLVLNKQDLVDPITVQAWKDYFAQNFPQLKCLAFNSFTSIMAQEARGKISATSEVKRKLRKQRRYESAKGVKELLEAIESFQLDKKIDFGQVMKDKLEEHQDDDSDSDEGNLTWFRSCISDSR